MGVISETTISRSVELLSVLKNILDFILVEERLDAFFLLLSWIAPSLGLLIGVVVGAFTRQVKRTTLRGLFIGFSGSFIYFLWLMYNAITDHFGIDSVKGLLINLGLFACIGIILGFILRRRQPQNNNSQ